jgi:cytoskeletal protein CcmA (bactofilin family)
MSDHLEADGSFINSIVGEGTRFEGVLELSGLLRIDGDFSGTIRTSGKVLVGKNGRAECTIDAGTVVVGGIIKGNIFSTEKVIILSTGIVIGNVNTPRLIVEEGVIMHGNCLVRVASPQSSKEQEGGKREVPAFSYKPPEPKNARLDAEEREKEDGLRPASGQKESVSWRR